jgi:hypothetical protein
MFFRNHESDVFHLLVAVLILMTRCGDDGDKQAINSNNLKGSLCSTIDAAKLALVLSNRLQEQKPTLQGSHTTLHKL